MTTKAPPPKRQVRAELWKRFEDTVEGKRLMKRDVFAFIGTDEQGRYVYSHYHNTFIGTMNHLRELLGRVESLNIEV